MMMQKKTWAVLLIPLCLTACHQTTNRSTAKDEILTGSYIDPTKTRFPLADYSQSVDKWIPPDSADYTIPVIDSATQQRYFSALKSHYFGIDSEAHSPWNGFYITALLKKNAAQARDASIKQFLSDGSAYWGENFRLYTSRWKEEVRGNTDTQIDNIYHASRRGIMVRESLVRALPTDDPLFNDPRQAGEGYPFDNLQMSSLRPGTPVYTLAKSKDQRWQYVVSPAVTGWVHSEDIASTDQKFITQWVLLAHKQLGAFINAPVSVHAAGVYYFTGRPGTILPFRHQRAGQFLIAAPVRGSNGRAFIHWVWLSGNEFTAMPWKMTPENIAVLMKAMHGAPYGWGNFNFYNDCSAEVRSLLMPFGIFLPRHSSAQVEAAGRVVDLSHKSAQMRIDYLTRYGKPFTTLVYIPGHIMLYIGNTTMNRQVVPMTYQNIWGLRPNHANSRSIIGEAVFLPLLRFYPENPELISLAGKVLFKLGYIE
ncbi:cell wall hydrolase [Salmonella enterica subsp. enterica serovar Warnow]|nr:cell wall hydrolase [Salmonella enterica subsp. enterica serovar Warnow]EHS4894278.1 SH3 domain-containing protein [Salmonella enterica]EBR0102989.1 cell wall hydrolase [Salmonella enterica subsp. enterica serovar Warnow]EHS4898019.1 SH3 domain-containing protein [Salmonella enterica]EHV4605072.1 SH3 domain-containing protein [Salmonella enterica]